MYFNGTPNSVVYSALMKMDTQSLERELLIEVGDAPVPNKSSLGSKVCGGAPCGFSDAKTSSKDAQERAASMRKLWIAVVLCVIFMTVEVVGGIKANSLAILTDAAHLLSDVASFAISLFSLWASGWEATPRQSYGFFRIEILGALVSIQLIWLLTGILVYEAIERLINSSGEVQGFLMPLLNDSTEGESEPKNTKKKQRNINVQGAYLHVLGDSIQSIGVMIGGAIIWYKPEWKIIDLVCTLIFSIVVLFTTIRMLRNILEVLMESTPREIDATRLEKGLCEMEEVVAIHELHIWAITVGKVLLACHVKIKPDADADLVLDKVIDYIRREYNISHVTIQIERG
nr:Metal tolerance protein 1 [Ipomoea batatas]